MQTKIASPTSVDMAIVARVSSALNQLRTELKVLFPQRENLIDQIVLALASREHVLVWGGTGTAKSALACSIFNAFAGAIIFETGLNRFSTAAQVVGLPDTVKMKDQGILWHRTEGSIIPAHLAYLDEFLDATPALLRVLLTILNERRFDQGTQHEKCLLLTAIATTNGDPTQAVKQYPEIAAVVDRFIYRCQVEALDEVDEQIAMLNTYLTGQTHSVVIDIDNFIYFTGLVTNYNLVSSHVLVSAYLKVINAFCKKAGIHVSDRTIAKATQVLEASALLSGRIETHPQDILAVKYALCDGNDTASLDLFDAIAKPIIEEAEAQMGQTIDDVQLSLIAELTKQVPTIPQGASKADLVDLARELTEMVEKVEAIKPQLPTTEAKRTELLTRLNGVKDKVMTRISRRAN